MTLTKKERQLYDKIFAETLTKFMSKQKSDPMSKQRKKKLDKLYKDVVKQRTGNLN